MLITRRRSQGRRQVIPAGGQPQQRSGIESWFLESARSPPPPRHALAAPTAPGGSVLLCPPAIPGDVSCVGRYIRGLSVSRSSVLTLGAAVRHRAGSRSWIFGQWSISVYSTTHASPWCESGQCSAGAQETPRTWRRTHSWAQDQQKTEAAAQATSPRAHADVPCLPSLRRLHPGVFANTKQL